MTGCQKRQIIPTKATINIICNNTTIMTDCIDRNNIITQNKKRYRKHNLKCYIITAKCTAICADFK